MNEILISAFFGILGALVRVLVDFVKVYSLERNVDYKRFLFYVIVVISIGAFSGIVLGYNKALGFLGGYAGLDLLDGYYKNFKKKKIKFEEEFSLEKKVRKEK